ncbi:(2Fe-2S) ferredoxin domain-containing protein [Myxacorys almedinensis]|uniref:(2Fe-2S) ferredoxin domain-containing protein n=1 Tax=Myxacorys almedinensis A TaxID=2690445 RepID=A0A8J7Z2H1_9CYAN|nr:(2Fe-2S) ferredoxin domain-containing protein [Myxacorys almedinensis]NDJ16966.1 (2Fe-2S) ferredoxin domain-containing protein [Myxacorys almedinensis A]
MNRRVLVCQYQRCLANGSAEVLAAFLATSPSECSVVPSECQGQCNLGVTVRILPDEVWYCRIKPPHVAQIVEQHLQQGQLVKPLLHPRIHPNYKDSALKN